MSKEPERNIKIEPVNNPAREIYDVLVIDRSSSISYQRDATIKGINEYIAKLKADADRLKLTTFISMICFDSTVETLFTFTDVKEVRDLDNTTYVPDGMTALNDAVGTAITLLRDRLKGREGSDDIDVTVTVFTDGDENESKRYPGRGNVELQNLVKELEDSYQWNFAFVGVGTQEQAVAQASTLGISSNSAMGYSFGSAGVSGAMGDDGMTGARSVRMASFASTGTKLKGYFKQDDPAENLKKS